MIIELRRKNSSRFLGGGGLELRQERVLIVTLKR